MIIFLYGQDTYRSRQKLNEIVEHYKKVHQSGLNLKYFDGQKLSYRDFEDEFRQAPMFQEKKLVILKNIFSNQEFKNSFLKNSKKFINSNDLILFYEKGEISSNDPLFKFLEKNAKTQSFKLLEGQRLRNWAKRELEKHQTKIEPQALEKLLNFVGNNLWTLSNEIKKLITFKNKGKIEIKDIDLLIRPKIETDIFKTIDALASKNKKQALSLIHKHLEKGESPLYLLSMINFQFRNILIIKSESTNDIRMLRINNLSKELRMHPYIIKKTMWQARKFTFEELKKIYHKLFMIDYKIKTGKIDPQTALDLFISEV